MIKNIVKIIEKEYHYRIKWRCGMTEKRFELKLCSNGTYYVYENGTLTDIDFDKFNKESADGLIDELNALYDENEQLKQFKNKVFYCIEKAVEETEKYNHSDTSRYYSRKDLLAKLQDGLTGDVE